MKNFEQQIKDSLYVKKNFNPAVGSDSKCKKLHEMGCSPAVQYLMYSWSWIDLLCWNPEQILKSQYVLLSLTDN